MGQVPVVIPFSVANAVPALIKCYQGNKDDIEARWRHNGAANRLQYVEFVLDKKTVFFNLYSFHIEQVEVYVQASDGSWGAPTPGASLNPDDFDRTWTAIYVDSPATLAAKLTLANDRGLAGGGFWAIGYERGLPGYGELMDAFTAGDTLP